MRHGDGQESVGKPDVYLKRGGAKYRVVFRLMDGTPPHLSS